MKIADNAISTVTSQRIVEFELSNMQKQCFRCGAVAAQRHRLYALLVLSLSVAFAKRNTKE